MKPGEVLAQLGSGDLRSIANALRSKRLLPPFSVASVAKITGPSMGTPVVEALQTVANKGLGAEQIAIALDLLVDVMDSKSPVEDFAQLVMTAPIELGAYHRDTRVVVTDLFMRAERAVVVAGYAVHQGKKIFEELAARMKAVQLLKVKLFLHVARRPEDVSPAAALNRFVDEFKAYHWPVAHPLPEIFFDRRGLDSSAKAPISFHAKCVIVDESELFISSANFTEAAQNRNIELGILLKLPHLAKQAAGFFSDLIADGVCERAL